MTYPSPEPTLHEPTLVDLIGWCRDAKFWILGGLLSGLLVALLWVLLAVPQYRVTMLVGPTTRTGTPDISALFPENASYALEYVLRSFGPGDSSDFMRFEAIMRGPMISRRLLDIPQVSQGLQNDRRWSFTRADKLESAEKLSAYLQKRIRIEPVGNTTMRRVVYHHANPDFACRFLSTLYATTDGVIRQEVREKAGTRIEGLKQTLRTANDPEHRRMLAKLLSDQEQVQMILALNEPFSAMLAEPPSVSAKPVWPDKKLLFPLLGFVGALLGFFACAASGRLRVA